MKFTVHGRDHVCCRAIGRWSTMAVGDRRVAWVGLSPLESYACPWRCKQWRRHRPILCESRDSRFPVTIERYYIVLDRKKEIREGNYFARGKDFNLYIRYLIRIGEGTCRLNLRSWSFNFSLCNFSSGYFRHLMTEMWFRLWILIHEIMDDNLFLQNFSCFFVLLHSKMGPDNFLVNWVSFSSVQDTE